MNFKCWSLFCEGAIKNHDKNRKLWKTWSRFTEFKSSSSVTFPRTEKSQNYALICDHPGGWLRWTPDHLHNDSYKSPLPKTKIVWQKATIAPPLGAKKCALPSQKLQYFKRVALSTTVTTTRFISFNWLSTEKSLLLIEWNGSFHFFCAKYDSFHLIG